ncbi:MAG: winged helix DNA-binding protein [Pseudomonadota bacterium]
MRDVVESPPVTEAYVEALSLVERLHRLLLDVVKDEFERVGVLDINAVQGLLLFNIGENVVTAGELRSRGYYQGSNVSYNLKKLVEAGYMLHERCAADKRAVRVRLSESGQGIRALIEKLFDRQAQRLNVDAIISCDRLQALTGDMRQMERFWANQIRFIY